MQALFYTLVDTLNSLLWLVLGAANLIGIGLVIIGLTGFVRSNNQLAGQRFSSSKHGKSVIIGSLLIVAVEVLDVSTQTVFGEPSRHILDHTLVPGQGVTEQARYLFGVVYAIVATVGFLAFIKGWLVLRSDTGQPRIGAGMVYIFAGMLAVNLDIVMLATAATVAQFSVDLAENIRLFTP